MKKVDRAKSLNIKSGTESVILRTQNTNRKPRPASDRGSRPLSLRSFKEFIECGLCGKDLNQPRTLPCEHTYCLNCLQANYDKNVKDDGIWNCPSCNAEYKYESKSVFEGLTSNIFLDESIFTLLKEISGNEETLNPTVDLRCINCKIVCQAKEQICQHCNHIFCQICWNEHVSELMSKLSTLEKQLDESEIKLNSKLKKIDKICDDLKITVADVISEKIKKLEQKKEKLNAQIVEFNQKSYKESENLKFKIEYVKKVIKKLNLNSAESESEKITKFIELHTETSKLLDEVSKTGHLLPNLDKHNLNVNFSKENTINKDLRSKIDDRNADNAIFAHYRKHNFETKLFWNKCPRPAGVGVSPWNTRHLYVCTTENKNVLIFDLSESKVVGRLEYEVMFCPTGITFNDKSKEIYVTDKRNHTIHVFSHDGHHLRTLCEKEILRSPEGLTIGPDASLLYVCDTGNDRVVVLDPVDGTLINIIGFVGDMTELNLPTGIAIYDNKIYITDSGNHRIKIYDLNNDNKLLYEFGIRGNQKGQLKSPETIAIDSYGCIFVGDSGNNRLQIFKLDGTLIRTFGETGTTPGKFLWISGITVTPDNDIIITDSKNRSLQIF